MNQFSKASAARQLTITSQSPWARRECC